MKSYPIQLDVSGRSCLVVGGGPIGLIKAKQLATSGAELHLVSRSFAQGFDQLEAAVRHERPFADADVNGMYLVHAATNDPKMNDRIANLCKERDILCCVATESSAGSFSVPAVMEAGDLRATIATNGASPSYGARLRREWSDQLPKYLQEYLDFLRQARNQSKTAISDPALRMRFNAYLASAVGEARFAASPPDQRATWVSTLLQYPKEIPESYTPTWERD
jgi:siroheme synthase-like protein